MLRGRKNTLLFLFVAIISANIHPSRCSQVLDYAELQLDPLDSHYDENKQELAEEIDDVDDYMRMIADRLTNDGVYVVRATMNTFVGPDVENLSKSKIFTLGAGGDSDSVCELPKKTTTSVETEASKNDSGSLPKNQNITSIDRKSSEIQEEINFEGEEECPVKIKNFTSRKSQETEIAN